MSVFGWDLPAGCGTLPGEEDDVYQCTIDGKNYAWDDKDQVWVYSGIHESDYDDGYRMIGKCQYNDDIDDPEKILREWVNEYNISSHRGDRDNMQ